ncbi:hypothetical protein MCOR25_004834 [Pyricularia grisea]|uniref:Major facilitator superfamily (MFS) profile domain-containing protein n=1 Tax=Pyricularia grisea TaxID=148305 RepID=A0A6P8B142_PYRGI|nr:uncharacterized protein PgNI_07353 [Pyricularia grisea]KAI6367758.1 hypothetical protein MCOR25_004834 [Pyricularia grisea]TLD08572.1 hypothetical protein PgNI_07353 [Pyricularia grisea]
MDPHTAISLFSIEKSQKPISSRDQSPLPPAKAHSRSPPSASQASEPIPLQDLGTSPDAADTNDQKIPDSDLERSHIGSPVNGNTNTATATETLQTVWDPYMNRFRLISGSLINFANGLNDSAPGALIPTIEQRFGIGYAVVSLIFVANALGFVAGAFCIDSIRTRLGTARGLVLADALRAIGYLAITCSTLTPFPVIACAFFPIGFGMAINISTTQIFCGSLRSGTALLGIINGAYGIGGTVGPLIATSIVTAPGATTDAWSRYYFITMGLAVFNGVFAYISFRHYEPESAQPVQQAPNDSVTIPPKTTPGLGTMLQALRNPVILVCALFSFAYQGAEVSISGWVISFLITARGGDPASVGYVTAGFWAGITIGRLLVAAPGLSTRVAGREVRFVFVCTFGSAVFEALVWAVPNVIGNAVSVSIVGLLLGPVYPCGVTVWLRLMGRRERLSGMGVITAFGSSGGAAAPFTTGLLAQVAGTFVLHPIAIGLFGIMAVCWWWLNRERKRVE